MCRRLLLVEALDSSVQADVRLGLLAARAAVLVSALPRGNQAPAASVVIRRGLTVRQTALLVRELIDAGESGTQQAILERWTQGPPATARPGVRAIRGVVETLAWDISTIRRSAGRLQAHDRALADPRRIDPSGRGAHGAGDEPPRHYARGGGAVATPFARFSAPMARRAILGIRRCRPVRSDCPNPNRIDAYRGRVQELLARYPDITAQRVFEILKDEGFTGGYTGVKRHLRRTRPAPKPTPSLEAPVFGPGKMAESDWSPYAITYTDGRSEIVQVFSYVLVYSKRKFYDAFGSPDLFALLDGHGARSHASRAAPKGASTTARSFNARQK